MRDFDQSEGSVSDIYPDAVLDTKGMYCPLPAIKTKKALEGLMSGQILEVIATDRGSITDINLLLSGLGYELPEMRDKGEVIEFYIRKK
jgi:TusA-related sulfurtransferase